MSKKACPISRFDPNLNLDQSSKSFNIFIPLTAEIRDPSKVIQERDAAGHTDEASFFKCVTHILNT